MALTYKQKEVRLKRLQDRFEEPMLLITLLMIPLIIIENADLGAPWPDIAFWLNWFIWSAFAVEFVVMLWAAPNKWRWLKKNPLEIAIVFLTPPFLPANLEAARLFRLLRLVRLFRLKDLSHSVFSTKGLINAAIIAGIVTLAGGLAFTIVERGKQNIDSWDGIYWAMTQVTAAGTSVPPQTEEGRILSLIVALAGAGFVAMLTAAFAQRFVEAERKRKQEVSVGEKKILNKIDELSERIDKIEHKR